MTRLNIIATVLAMWFLMNLNSSEIFAQNHNYEFFLSITTSGGGAGAKLRWDTQSKWVKTLSLQLGGVRGEKEFTSYDYIYGIPRKINQNRYVVLSPLYFGLQRIVFKDAIENNVKPFLVGEIGPTLGAWFPVGYGLGGNLKRGKTGLTVGGFLGGGIEIGSGKGSRFSLSLGARIVNFFERLGDVQTGDKHYNAFEVRFGFVTSF